MIRVLRSSLTTILIAAVFIAAFWHLRDDEYRRMNAELRALNEEMAERLEEREAMLDRLSASRRVAHVHIVDQDLSDDDSVRSTTLKFIELNEQGRPIGEQVFTIPGRVLYIDGWTVRFPHDMVAAGHPLYGRTMVLFRRIYSEMTAPIDGEMIDTPGAIPPGYAADDPARLEKRLWDQFWQIASDATLAREMNVRVAQGEAVYKPVEAGQSYELVVDAAAGMTLVPMSDEAAADVRRQSDFSRPAHAEPQRSRSSLD